MNLKSIPKKRKDIESEKIDDETIILLLETGKFYNLNSSGSIVWNLINGKRNIEEIIVSMSKKFSVGKKALEKDVIEMLNKLEKNKLIEF
ncbi:PqqD family protein [archaeon]|nr:PqqD family protein [archaeon]MBL7057008.1 PqqD family protein [Candidatus Woesearchaeota archaeon]